MANSPLTLSMITNEALFILKNSLRLARYVDRSYDKSFGQSGAKIGTVLNVRKPARYVAGNGPKLALQDFAETSAPLALDQQPNVGIQFTSAEQLLSIDEYSRRVLAPAVATIANVVDVKIAQNYKLIWNFVGTVGTSPATTAVPLGAGALLDDNAVPRPMRYMVLTPAMIATEVAGLQGLFNNQKKLSDQYDSGQIAQGVLGFDWDQDQNIIYHTVGNAIGTAPLSGNSTNSAVQTGSAILTDGWTATTTGILKDGDIITFAGCYMVNPQSRLTTNRLQQFTVVGDTDSDGSGNATVNVSPAVVPSGPYQNVTAAIADNSAIGLYGVLISGSTYPATSNVVTPQGLAFQRDCFTLACADLPLPGGVDFAQRASDDDLNLSIRIIRQYGIMDDVFPCRVDLLFGTTSLRPELGCRVGG